MVATGAMKDRAIVFGTIGCPVCKAEFLVVNRVARFGEPEISAESGALPVGAEAVQALLGLASPGGFVVLVGSGAVLAGELAGLMVPRRGRSRRPRPRPVRRRSRGRGLRARRVPSGRSRAPPHRLRSPGASALPRRVVH